MFLVFVLFCVWKRYESLVGCTVLVTDSAWFMFRWCRDCTGILQSPSFFCNHKAIQKNTHQLHINTKHHFVSLCAVYRTSFWAFQNDGKDCTMISLHRGPSQCGTEGTACPVQGVGHAENGDSKWTRSSWFQQIVSWFCVKHIWRHKIIAFRGRTFPQDDTTIVESLLSYCRDWQLNLPQLPCCKRGSPLHSDEKLGEFFVISFVVFVHRPRGLGNQEKWMRNTQDHESLRSWIASTAAIWAADYCAILGYFQFSTGCV